VVPESPEVVLSVHILKSGLNSVPHLAAPI
jgi:hypothetical protein